MKMPLIFDIKRCSGEDGPGIRTTVFLKGCNLNCWWCHNPEGKRPEYEDAFFAEKCIGCGSCADAPDPENCPSGARRRFGQAYSMDQLMAVIESDRDYYAATGGGVTFSGGESMLYPDFLASMAQRCAQCGIHVAIDTAGNVPWTHFEQVLAHTELFLYDIKCINPELHLRGTGCRNERILENLERLLAAKKQVIIRIPLIPGFNEGEELEKICSYCAERGLPHEILPYHDFGTSKLQALRDARSLLREVAAEFEQG